MLVSLSVDMTLRPVHMNAVIPTIEHHVRFVRLKLGVVVSLVIVGTVVRAWAPDKSIGEDSD